MGGEARQKMKEKNKEEWEELKKGLSKDWAGIKKEFKGMRPAKEKKVVSKPQPVQSNKLSQEEKAEKKAMRQKEVAEKKAMRQKEVEEQIAKIDGFYIRKKRVIQEEQYGLQVMWGLSRLLAGALGVLGMCMAVVGFMTIIGIPLALIMMNGAKGFLDYAGGKRAANCPNCQKKTYVHVDQTKFACRKCQQHIDIVWE